MSSKMTFTKDVYEEIKKTVGTRKVETGGILLGDRNNYIVKKFIFDPSGSTFSAGYNPDINFLNKRIKEEWANNKLALLGFVHSHPRGISRLSGDIGNNIGDIGYIKGIFNAIEALDKFLVPIVYSTHDGGKFEIFPYMAERGKESNYKELELSIMDDYDVEKIKKKQKEDNNQENNLNDDLSVFKGVSLLAILSLIIFMLSKNG